MTSTPETKATPLLSADEYFWSQSSGLSELVAGRVVLLSPAAFQHGTLVSHLGMLLLAFVKKNGLGVVLSGEAGFVIARNPDTVRAPDVAFVSTARLSLLERPDRFFPAAPDLAVEVVSPSDRWVEVQDKVVEYLAGGTSEVWVGDPKHQAIHVSRRGTARVFSGEESLTSDLLPGFVLPLRELFG